MFDFMNKLGDLKNKMEGIKARLDEVVITGTAGDREVVATVTGNRKLVSIRIAPHLLFPEKQDEVQELVEVAVNRALDAAEKRAEEEMRKAGRDLLPGLSI